MDIDVGNLLPSQLSLIDATINGYYPLHLILGAVGSGKTIGAIGAFLMHVKEYSNQDFAMVGVSAQSINRTQIPIFEAWLDKMVGPKGYTYKRSTTENCIQIHSNGNRIWVIPANNEASVKVLKGANLGGAYVDEGVEIPQSFFEEIFGRLRGFYQPRVYLTTNPAGPNHWLKTNFFDKSDELGFFHQKVSFDENTYNSEEWKNLVKASYTEHRYKQMIDCEWVGAEGAVYPLFHTVSTKELDLSKYPIYLACDFGTSTVTTGLFLAEVNMREYVIFDEYYDDAKISGHSLLPDEHVDKMLGLYPDLNIKSAIIDPSASPLEVAFRRNNIFVILGINDLHPGINTTDVCLKNKSIQISDSKCPNLKRDLSELVWDKNGENL